MFTCCSATYYSQSQRHFHVRTFEHLWITPVSGNFAKASMRPAIFDLMPFLGHTDSFNDFSILLKVNNGFKLQLKESLLI